MAILNLGLSKSTQDTPDLASPYSSYSYPQCTPPQANSRTGFGFRCTRLDTESCTRCQRLSFTESLYTYSLANCIVCFTYSFLSIRPSSQSAKPMTSKAAWLVEATVCGLKPARASPTRTTLSLKYRFFGEMRSVIACTNGFFDLCAISAI